MIIHKNSLGGPGGAFQPSTPRRCSRAYCTTSYYSMSHYYYTISRTDRMKVAECLGQPHPSVTLLLY